MTNPEPVFDIAHLAHVELLTLKLEETRQFFVDVMVMGMYESGRAGDSIYLRGWDDYEHHSLQLMASSKPGPGALCLPRDESAGVTATRGSHRENRLGQGLDGEQHRAWSYILDFTGNSRYFV